MGIFKRNTYRLEYEIRIGVIEVYGLQEPPPIAVLLWQRGSKRKGSTRAVTFDSAARAYVFNEDLPIMVCSLRAKTKLIGGRADAAADNVSSTSNASSSLSASMSLHTKFMNFELHEVDRDGRIKKEVASGKLNLASVIKTQETLLVPLKPTRGPALVPPLAGLIKAAAGGGSGGGPQPILKVGVCSRPPTEASDPHATAGSVGGGDTTTSDLGSQKSVDTTGGEMSDTEEDASALLSARSVDRSPRVQQQQASSLSSSLPNSVMFQRVRSPHMDAAPSSTNSSNLTLTTAVETSTSPRKQPQQPDQSLQTGSQSSSDPSIAQRVAGLATLVPSPLSAVAALVDTVSTKHTVLLGKPTSTLSAPLQPPQQQQLLLLQQQQLQQQKPQSCVACQTDEDPLRKDVAALKASLDGQRILNTSLRRQIATYAESIHRIIQQDESPRLISISATAANSNPQYEMDADDLDQMSWEGRELLASLSNRIDALKRKEKANAELLSRISATEGAFNRINKTFEEQTQKLREREKQLATAQSMLHDMKKQLRSCQRQLEDARSQLNELIADRRRVLSEHQDHKRKGSSPTYHVATSLMWGLVCTALGFLAIPYIAAIAPGSMDDDWSVFVFRFALRLLVFSSIYTFFGQRFSSIFGFKTFLFEIPRLLAGNDDGTLSILSLPVSKSIANSVEPPLPPSNTTRSPTNETVVTLSTLRANLIAGLSRGLYLGAALVAVDRLFFTWFLTTHTAVLWKRAVFAVFTGFIEEVRGRMFFLPVVLIATDASCKWLGITYTRRQPSRKSSRWTEYVSMLLPYLIIAMVCSFSFDGIHQFRVQSSATTMEYLVYGLRKFLVQFVATLSFSSMYEQSFIFEGVLVGHIAMSVLMFVFGLNVP